MSHFEKLQQEDAAKIRAYRQDKYNENCRQLMTEHIQSRFAAPITDETKRLLRKALEAGTEDPYGDGDQSPYPDEATLRRIASMAKTKYEEVCMIDDAGRPLRTAWNTQLDYLSAARSNDFHLWCFVGDINGVVRKIRDARELVRNGDQDALKHLLEKRISNLRLSPLHYCVMATKGVRVQDNNFRSPWNEIAEALLEAGARVDSRDIAGCTPLGCAVGMGATDLSAQLIDVLLKHGADPNGTLRFSSPFALGSISTNNVVIFKKLLQAGLDLSKISMAVLPVVWNSPGLMNALMEVQRNRMLKLEECAACGKKNVTKYCSVCKKSYYCSRECQMENWKDGHKKSCKNVSSNQLLDVSVETMTFKEISYGAQHGMINPVTGVCPHFQMKPKNDNAWFIAKLTAVLVMEESKGDTHLEPYVGCVKIEEQNAEFLLLKKSEKMKGMHKSFRKYITEKSGGAGMVYVLARWTDKETLQIDLSRPIPPPTPWW